MIYQSQPAPLGAYRSQPAPLGTLGSSYVLEKQKLKPVGNYSLAQMYTFSQYFRQK